MEEKLWTKDFICLIFANFCASLVFFLFLTTIVQYTIQAYQVSTSTAGLIAGIFVGSALITRLFTGKFLDVIGRKKVTRIGMFCFLLCTASYFLANDIISLFIVRFLHGLAFGVTSTATNTIGQSMFPDSRRGEGTGYLSLGQVFAMAIGPLLGLFLMNRFDYDAVILLCTLSSAACFILLLVIKIDDIKLPAEVVENIKKSFKFKDFIEMHALPLSTIMIICGICYNGLATFVNSYTAEINLSQYSSLFFLVYAVAVGIARPLGGRLMDRKGENIIVYSALVCFVIGFIFMANIHGASTLLLSAVLLAIGFGTTMSCGCAIVVKLTPRQRIGMAISTFFICLDTGTALGPYLLGLVIPHSGYRSMYLMLAAVTVLLIVQYYFVHGRKVKYIYKKPVQELEKPAS